jgi:hypothetical protein
MAIVFTCPRCDRKYSVSDAMAGRRVTCKGCGQEFPVPGVNPSMAFDDDDDGPPIGMAAPPRASRAYEDVLSPVPPRSRAASYEEDDGFDRPSARGKKKKGQPELIAGFFPRSTKSVVILLVALVMAAFGISVANKALQRGGIQVEAGSLPFALTMIVLIVAVVVMIGCGLANLAIILAEDGLLAVLVSLFIPLAGLIFIIKNWDRTARYVGGQMLCVLTLVGCALLLPAMNGANGLGAAVNNANNAVNQAGFNDPADFGPEEGVIVQVSGLDDEAMWKVFGDKLTAAGKQQVPGRLSIMMVGNGNEMTFQVGPRRDAQGLADLMTFARIDSVKGNVIRARQNLPADEVARVRTQLADEKAQRDAAAQVGANDGGVANANPGQPDKPKVDPSTIDGALETLKNTREHFKCSEAIKRLAWGIPPGRKPEVVAALIPLLAERDIFNAKDALETLAALKDPASVPAIIVLIERRELMRDAIEVLGKIKDPRAAAPIADRLESAWPAANEALIAMGPAAETAVLEKLRDPQSRVRSLACEVLEKIGGKETLKTMMTLPADPDTFVRMAANGAMKNIVERVGPIPEMNRPAAKKGR